MEAVAEEAEEGADEEDEPEGEVIGGDAGDPPEELAGVVGGGEVVEVELGGGEDAFELGGVGGEIGVGAIDGLEPDCGH